MSPDRNPSIEALFAPVEVRAFAAPASDRLIDALLDEERVGLAAMAPRRRAEFATARACAHHALRELDGDGPILRTDGGAPGWPRDVTGSISHTKGYCLAVATREAVSVGIDVEEIDRMSAAVERRILVDDERNTLDGLSDGARRERIATIFAAKEAFYKAHYVLDPRYLGFDVVAVTVEDDHARFRAMTDAVHDEIAAASRARVRIEDGRVVVGVTIATTALGRPLPSTG